MKKKAILISVSIILVFVIRATCQITFTQIGTDLYGENNYDHLGHSPSINDIGDVIAVGAPYYSTGIILRGQVKAYELVEENWVQKGSDILGSNQEDGLGWSVCLNGAGDIMVIGVPYNQDAGSYYGKVLVYRYVNHDWQQLGNTIYGETEGELSGWTVSINASGYTVAVGAIEVVDGDVETGLIRVYDYNQITDLWEKFGQDMNGNTIESYFGYSLDLNEEGTIVAAGGPDDYSFGEKAGIVKIFERNGNDWQQKGQTLHGQPNYQFGWSLSFNGDGNIIAIGANTANYSNGMVKVFSFTNNYWEQVGNNIEGDLNWAGYSVALNTEGTRVSVGFSGDMLLGYETGLHKVFELCGDVWEQIGYTLYGQNMYDLYGSGTDFNSAGDIFIVSARNSSQYGTNRGQVQIFKIEDINNIKSVSSDNIFSVNFEPYSNELSITCKNNINEVIISNIYGKKILEYKCRTGKIASLQLNKILQGIYLVTVFDSEQNMYSKKILMN